MLSQIVAASSDVPRGAFVSLAASFLLLASLPSSLAADAPGSEPQLIQVLQSDASPRDKNDACSQLKRLGTAASVPALTALLTDEQLSHSARYVLESMPAPEAGRALLAALEKTSGATRIGIIDSLGVRRETAADSVLTKLAADQDPTTAGAAIAALGHIGGGEALAALRKLPNDPTAPTHAALADSLLQCANRLLASGDASQAQPVFDQLYHAEKADALRSAAFRGLVLSSGNRAAKLMADAIAGQPGPAQSAALQLVHVPELRVTTKSLALLLPRLAPPVQAALIDGLSQRGDPAAAAAIAALAASPEPFVRLSALEALGWLGDASQVSLLSEAAASATGPEQTAARDALAQLRRGPVTETLLTQLPKAKPAVQAEIARALGVRSDAAAIPKLLALARSDSDSARQSALRALAQLAEQSDLTSLVALVYDARGADARAQAAEALNSACLHFQSRHGKVGLESLLKGMESGSPEARAALLPVCAQFNDPQVRTSLRGAVADSNSAVRTAAIRALCDTTDPELLPDLLKLACSLPEENLRTLAVGGCVRLATQEESVKLPNPQRVQTLKSILDSQPTVEQKRLVLAGLAEVPSPAALRLAEPLLDETAVQAEAARTVLKLAAAKANAAEASVALKKVLAVTQDPATRQAAEAALSGRNAGDGFITAWQVAGPYLETGKNFRALFDTAFPPELADAKGIAWQTLTATTAGKPGVIDLLGALGGEERVAYARATIRSDREQPARLEIGSDDGVKVWLNQKLVHAKNVSRAIHPGSDKVDVVLRSGANELLLKITQHNQGWAFCARFVQPNGSALGGLTFDTPPPGTKPAGVLAAKKPPAASPPHLKLGPRDPLFKKIQLTDQFWSEGADFGDFNHDGQMDIVSGPFWYEGPGFKKRHEIWPATNSFKLTRPDGSTENVPGFEGALGEKNTYSEAFFAFTYDFNSDGWPDVLIIGFPGKAVAWFENPKGAEGFWPRHQIFDEVGDESPVLADITGDGKPEILCCARGHIGYVEADWKNPAAPWTFHPISPKGDYQKFTHGIGYGDINGDGRTDIIEKDGWWEQPASREGDPVWVKHPFHFADAGAQMLVFDVNGDGLADVITSLHAHRYGLAWYEQVRTNGEITFRQHLILNPDATPNAYGVSFTQPHSVALADVDGDGLMDIVTGKRFWAHGKKGGDPESDGYPAVLYWFQMKRSANGQVDFIPHLVDDNSGVGTQVVAGHVQNSRFPDIVVGNKKGTFVFLNQRKGEAERAQTK